MRHTEGMLGSLQYDVSVFLQYELAKPVIALSALATFASCSGSGGSLSRREARRAAATQ